MKILTFGEIIWDVYPDKKCLGGAPLNFAAHAHRAGADAYLLSAVGDDELGHEAIKLVNKYGVKADHISVLGDMPTGQCTVSLSETGVPSYEIVHNVAYDKITFSDDMKNMFFDTLCFGTLALRGEANRVALKKLLSEVRFGEIFVDLNLRAPFYSAESILTGLENATILKISDEEFPAVMKTVFGEAGSIEGGIKRIAKKFGNIRLIVLTCGGEGSVAFDLRNNEVYRCEAVKTEVVSTVGAGDSYGATFLVNYLKGDDIDTCLKKASEVSAFVVSRAEAIPE